MSEEFNLSIDSLIKDALDGKSAAIARYDDIIWKIRVGYAVLLYGAVGIVASLVDTGVTPMNSTKTLSAIFLLVGGFSAFGACIDYSFISAKLRVVMHRDRLVEFAYSKATIGSVASAQSNELLECLKNSGERSDVPVDWSNKVGRWIPLIYYGGTGAICTSAICMPVMACQ